MTTMGILLLHSERKELNCESCQSDPEIVITCISGFYQKLAF